MGTAAPLIENDIVSSAAGSSARAARLRQIPAPGHRVADPSAPPCSSPPATVIRLPPGVDRIDLRILRTLQRSGRISYQKLGDEVHLSPTAVFERVKRLEREGFILGYEARLDASKLGAGGTMYVQVRLERACIDAMGQFNEAVRACPEVMECHLVGGDCDYLMKIRVADDHAIDDPLPASIRSLPGVREMRGFGMKAGLKQERALSF